ncbi:hypothetical protein E1265_14005 [Streptomyces sp. 8K308]|nr:hypothetical protein E1265_14005 [Streptomyces sp. 8K308]
METNDAFVLSMVGRLETLVRRGRRLDRADAGRLGVLAGHGDRGDGRRRGHVADHHRRARPSEARAALHPQRRGAGAWRLRRVSHRPAGHLHRSLHQSSRGAAAVGAPGAQRLLRGRRGAVRHRRHAADHPDPDRRGPDLPQDAHHQLPRAPGAGRRHRGDRRAVPHTQLILNNARAPFDDERVRRAVQAAIDTAEISDAVYPGAARPAVGPFAPDEPFAPAGAEPVAAAPAAALFDEAGVDPGSLDLTLTVYTEGTGFADPHSCDGGFPLTQLCDPEVDELIAQAAPRPTGTRATRSTPCWRPTSTSRPSTSSWCTRPRPWPTPASPATRCTPTTR